MANTEKINFRQSRDFGETFGVSIKFLKQNGKLLFQSLIYIAGPFLLLSAIAGAFYQSNALNMYSITNPRPGGVFAQFGWSYLIFIVAAVIANLSLVATVYAYMIEYMEKGPGNFTVSNVGQRVVQSIGKVLSVFLLMFLIGFLLIIILVGIFIGVGSASPALAIFLGFLLIIGMIILFPPLMWQLSVVYLIRMQEGRSVTESFARSRDVMRDNFWWTWVIVICSSLAVGIIGIVFTLPQTVFNMVLMISHMRNGGDGETSIAFIIVATVCTFCTTLLYAALYIINAFHYYSLAEKKDGIGLMERINEIGSTPNQHVDQQY